MNEPDFIAALRNLPLHRGARGLKDDCAILETGGETLILTHDTMVENVHFLPSQDPSDIAYRLVATNMSDLAAKGAKPLGCLLSYTVGIDDERFLDGLQQALSDFGTSLLGGDTVSGNGLRTLGLTAIGTATHIPVPSRAGAQPDDVLYVTGPLGGAMMGFEALSQGKDADTLPYRRPKPLLKEGQLLAPCVTAIMDISDGLLLDCYRMAEASGMSINIDTARVPILVAESRRHDALRWGDDYQLLFTANRATELPLLAYRIGTVLKSADSPLLIDGHPPDDHDSLGFVHQTA